MESQSNEGVRQVSKTVKCSSVKTLDENVYRLFESYSKTFCCINLESRRSAVVALTCLNNLKCYAVRFFKSLTAFQMSFYIPQTRHQPIVTQCDRRLTVRSSMLTSEQTKLGIRNEIVNILTIKGIF